MSRLSHEAVLHEWVMPFFLGSGFLVAAAAVIVPIALHLLQRRRPRPVMFGTLRFLRDAIAQSRRAHRITQGLTLLMRILIIFCLAFALRSASSFQPSTLALRRQRDVSSFRRRLALMSISIS